MHALLHAVPPSLQQATANPRLHWRLLDTHRQVWVSLLWGHCSLLLGPGAHKVWFVPFRVYFPVLCKFWRLCGGVNGDLLQEGLCHTQVSCTQSPCLCSSPLLTWPPQETLNTILSQSLWGLWVLVCTRFVWALWASLAVMGFDSKCDSARPTVFRGKQPQVKKMFNLPLVCIFYPPQVMQSGSVFEGGQYFSSLEKELDLLGNQWFSLSTGLSITQESHGMCVFLALRFCLPEGTDTLAESCVLYKSKGEDTAVPLCPLWNYW